jgi:DNA-binding transcriptional LysR family regulator
METTAAVRLPALLAEFHRNFPAVRLTLRTAPTADLVAAVLDGALDGAFVAGPIEHAELSSTLAFREELVLVTARRWSSLASLRAGTPESGPTALVFRTGCTYRQRLEQVFAEFGWPSAARFELGTLDGMIGCVAADMGVTLLPRAVVERDHVNRDISIHTLAASQSRVDTLFIQRRSAHQYSALQGFVTCLTKREEIAAA